MFRSLTKHASGVLERLADPFFETIGQGSLSPIVGEAVEVAVRAGSPTTEAEHLLLAIANDGDSSQQRILLSAGLDYETIREALDRELEQSLEAVGMSRSVLEIPLATNRQDSRPEFGASFRRAVQRATEVVSEDNNGTVVEPPHLLLGVLAAEVGTVPRALALAGIDRKELIVRVRQILTASKPAGRGERVALINAFEPELGLESDAQLRKRMDILRERASNGDSLDALLPECFAIVRETGKRTVGMRHFDVQLIGGMALHEGRIAEMKTGEGKTLTATLAVILNSLAVRNPNSDSDRADGRCVHVVTVNDYLAHRDADWMGPIYETLGLTVGVLANTQSTKERQQAYACDVVYGANSEFGLDYLRDNMAKELSERVQRAHAFAIVDEVDTIMIDEASSPLVLSDVQGQNNGVASITCQKYFRLYGKLAGMTGTALTEASEFMQVYELEVVQVPTNRPVIRVDRNDQVYKTKEGKLSAVVNEISRRHTAGQPVLAGTISVVDSELLGERLTQRGIEHTVLRNTKPEHAAREAEIVAQAGQPGAVTIITNMAGRGVDIKLGGDPERIAHQQLAGEGVHPTDADEYFRRISAISPEVRRKVRESRERVIAAGGLFICATERHESRRLDDQLRGRSGGQGDPGESRFFLSAEDDLVRLFAGDRIYKILDRLGDLDDEGNEEPIEAGMLSKQIEKAQKKVEEQSFLIRKRVLENEDMMSQ